MVRGHKDNTNHIWYLIGSIFYKIAIDSLYIFGTSIIYSYLGRGLDFNVEKYIVGWIVFIVFLYFIERIIIDRIRFMIKCIFLLLGVSNLSVYGLRNFDTQYFLIVILFWFLMIGICLILPHIKQFIEFTYKPFTKEISFNNKDELLLIIGLLITVIEVSRFGLNVTSFADIYSARDSFRSNRLSTIDSYLLSWNGTVILPWCFLVLFKRKKYIKALISVFLAVLMFLINGLKTWIVMYLIIISFSIILKKKNDYDFTLNVVLIGLSAMIFASLFYFSQTLNYELVGLLDRTVILPGELNYFYLDFFKDHELLYLRESIFKIFGKSPYSPWSAVQISQTYMSAAYYHNATNGLIGDIYGNFGIVGIFLYPIMIILTFIVLNRVLEGYDKTIISVVIFILMWLLINTSFFTWLMTGGYFIYLIILYLYKKYRIRLKH